MSVARAKRIILAALAAAAMAVARKPGDPIKPGWNLFSKQQDVQLGQEAADQVRRQYQVVADASMQDYLKRLGERLAATSPCKQSGFPFRFTLVNQPEVNAFALPGGPMFVFSGIFKTADNEAQLAGVMGHEMAHVILRHGTNQVSKANLLQLPAMLAGAVMGEGSLLGQLGQLGVGLGANSVLLKFSRDAETQADLVGARIIAEAGYNPLELARFFEKLEGSGGGRGPQFLSDHPNPGNRMKAIEAEIVTFPRRSYGFEVGGFQSVKQRAAALRPPPKSGAPSPAQSAAPPSTPPTSDGWKQHKAPTYSVAYPGNWEFFGDSQSSMATVAPREGLVKGRDGATQVGYGATLSFYSPRGAGDLASATSELLGQLRAANPTMQPIAGGQKRTRIAGADAMVNLMQSSSAYGGSETDAIVTLVRPEGLFYMVFIAPEKDFRQLESTFTRMLDSLQFPR
jgi:Zn-dependent protease with chaperone function